MYILLRIYMATMKMTNSTTSTYDEGGKYPKKRESTHAFGHNYYQFGGAARLYRTLNSRTYLTTGRLQGRPV